MRFTVDNGRIRITLDADFANIIRLPAKGTAGIVRLKIHLPSRLKMKPDVAGREFIQEETASIDDARFVVCVALEEQP